jgi:poly-D-alanine transfer protein DltD
MSVATPSCAVCDVRAKLGSVGWVPFDELMRVFLKTGSATVSGYTLKREQVAL